MTWLRRHQLRQFITNSIWVEPTVGMLAALAVVRVLYLIDRELGLEAPSDPEVMRTLLGTLSASMFTFVVFACSALLIAVQLASAQLTPRIIAFVFRDPVTKHCLTLVTQLLPLCGGLALRHWRPGFAERLLVPANRISGILSLATVALILSVRFHLLTQIRLRGYIGMLTLLAASLVGGYLFGGSDRETRKAMTLTTSLRNVGVALVIATGSFGHTAAVTAVIAYGLIEIFGSMLLAWGWGRQTAARVA